MGVAWGMADLPDATTEATQVRPEAVAILVENHRAFLRYLERRTGNRAVAEDLLQDAFIRTLDKADAVPAEALVPWFYRVLRNAVIDRARRRGAEDRALTAFGAEMAERDVAPPDLRREICACVTRLAATLKPEYAAALRAVDVEGDAVATYARATGLTATNAGVRLHRARKALKAQLARSCGTCADHGCVDCACGKGRSASGGSGP